MIRFIKFLLVVLGLALVAIIGYKAVKFKLDPNKEINIKMSSVTAEVRNKQLECLARNIYYEAGSEPFEGNVVYSKVLCQFSWYCEGPSKVPPKHVAAFKESEIVARQVLLEGFRLPSITDALYFHGDYINPGWKREKVAKIGRHIFYK